MSKPPQFSVVMPTRNRADYLPIAIQSVLNQTCGDFELIVSDNFSEDNTSDVVKSFDDPRIRYVRTGESLPINKSWEFGVTQAQGEYVVFLSDDDAYAKIYLESFEEEIRASDPDVIACGMLQYYEGAHFESDHRVTCENFTNRAYRYDCQGKKDAVWRYMFAKGGLTDYPDTFAPVGLPYLANAAYRRAIFGQVEELIGSIFPRELSSTDVYSTAVVLSQFTGKYCFLDKPLYLQRASSVSLTRSPDIENQRKTYGRPTHDLGGHENYFVDFAYANRWIEACLLAVIDTKTELDFELCWAKYYVKSFDSLRYLQSHGFDMRDEMKSFWKTLEKQDRKVREEVLSVVATPRMRISDFLRGSKVVGPLVRARDGRRRTPEDVVGIDDPLSIDEYAGMIDEKFLNDHSRLE